MRTLQVEAVYEHGTLKLSQELPLPEGQRVTITIHPGGAAERMYGILPWNGDPEELHRYLDDPGEGQWGTMTFDAIPAGLPVFLDANCLIYEATADPTYGPACKRLLERIENKEFPAYTSAHVLAETAHRLMTIEAAILFSRPLTGMVNWLRRHPAEVQRLTRHRLALDALAAIPLTILPVTGALVSRGRLEYPARFAYQRCPHRGPHAGQRTPGDSQSRCRL